MKTSRLFLRDYIQQALYHPTLGYFSKTQPPLLRHSTALNIPSLPNQHAYEAAISSVYTASAHGWMTPVELFSPHLSHAFANRVREAAPPDRPVHVIEIGAGRATLASDVLSHLQHHHPAFFSRLTYTVLDVSPALSNLQRTRLHPWISSSTANVVCDDARHFFESFQPHPDTHVHVIATEVLDNLPHDLVRVDSSSQLFQAVIHHQSDLPLTHRDHRSLHWQSPIDTEANAAMHALDLLSETTPSTFSITSLFENLLNGGFILVWIPTAAYQLMRSITKAIPTASLTIADFTAFPGTLSGLLAPVVQRVRNGTAVVYQNIEQAPFGQVDIMFPTDFERLSHAHALLVHDHTQQHPLNILFCRHVLTQRRFFERFTPPSGLQSTTCGDGYNPVLQDFQNTAVLMVDAVTP